MRPSALESVRADASTLEAVAKRFAAYRLLCSEFRITCAAQVWNTDESMMNAEGLMETNRMTVVAVKDDARPEFVIPSVQSGAEAASLVATVCADGTRLPLLLVVTGSGGRVPYAVLEQDDGSTRKTLLASYLGEGAEVHRREKPGFDGPLWELYARFAARNLEKKCPGEWTVLLMDGCQVHASSAGLTVLKQSKVVVRMFPSHLSHILQALDKDPLLKVKARGRTAMLTIIPTLLPLAKFKLVHLMRVINESAFYGLSSVIVINGFRQTGTWPINPTAIDVFRLVKGKGPVNAKWKVNLEQLIVRLGPEARRKCAIPCCPLARSPRGAGPSRPRVRPSSRRCESSTLWPLGK